MLEHWGEEILGTKAWSSGPLNRNPPAVPESISRTCSALSPNLLFRGKAVPLDLKGSRGMGGWGVDRLQTSALGHLLTRRWAPHYKDREGPRGLEEVGVRDSIRTVALNPSNVRSGPPSPSSLTDR